MEKYTNIIQQMKQEDKIDLLEQLKENTFPERFEQLLASLKTDELTLEEITKEVEEVRQKRFDEGKHKEASGHFGQALNKQQHPPPFPNF